MCKLSDVLYTEKIVRLKWSDLARAIAAIAFTLHVFIISDARTIAVSAFIVGKSFKQFLLFFLVSRNSSILQQRKQRLGDMSRRELIYLQAIVEMTRSFYL